MRGSRALAVAVRNPEGEIVTHVEPLNPRIYGGRLARTPFVRGLTLLWDALGLGVKALMFSAEVAVPEEEKDEAGNAFSAPMQWGTVALSLALGIGLFFVLPVFLASLIERLLGLPANRFVANLIEGLVRLALLIGYIWAVGLLPDIRRVYGYHGAEHKTIHAYEAGAPLTPASTATFPREHPRCGTAFLLTVVIFSVLVYSLLPPLGLLWRIGSRLLLLPVIAGIAYEFIRFSARHQDNALVRFISRPNLALQRLTTREPDDSMLAVAIVALEHVLAHERAGQAQNAPAPAPPAPEAPFSPP